MVLLELRQSRLAGFAGLGFQDLGFWGFRVQGFRNLSIPGLRDRVVGPKTKSKRPKHPGFRGLGLSFRAYGVRVSGLVGFGLDVRAGKPVVCWL